MTKLEQHLLEINKYLKVEPDTPADVLQYIKERCINTLQKTNHLQDDDDESEFFDYVDELCDLISLVPRDFVVDEYIKDLVNSKISSMPWDNFMSEGGEVKGWKDEIGEGDFMALGSMFYNKLSWISEGSENEYLTDFADEFGDDLLIDFLNELEVLCK